MNFPQKQLTVLFLPLFLTIVHLPVQGQEEKLSPKRWFKAAKTDTVETIDSFLEQDFPANKTNSRERTALHVAARNGSTTVINRLLKAGAYLYKKGKKKKTPLMLAAKNNKLATVKLLIQAGETGARHRTNLNAALFETLTSGDASTEILRILIKAGADVHASNLRNDRTPLLAAVHTGQFQKMKTLLNHGANPDAIGRHTMETPLLIALKRSVSFDQVDNDPSNDGGDEDRDGGFGNNSGSGFGSSESDSGGGFGSSNDGGGGFGSTGSSNGGGFGSNQRGGGFGGDSRGFSTNRRAGWGNPSGFNTRGTNVKMIEHPVFQNMVKSLLDAGADVHRPANLNPPLYVAVRNGCTKLVQRLLKANANPFRVISRDDLERPHLSRHKTTIKYFRLNRNIPSSDKQKITRILTTELSRLRNKFLTQHGTINEKQQVRLLLMRVNDHEMMTNAMQLLERLGSRALGTPPRDDVMNNRTMKNLLQKRLANYVPKGWFRAAQTGNLKLMKTIQKGWDAIDATDQFCRTALHDAASNGQNDVVQYLINSGASPNHQSIFGHTPLNAALLMDEPETARILREAGATFNEFTHPPLIHKVIDLILRTGNKEPFRLLMNANLQAPNLVFQNETPLTRLIKTKAIGERRRSSKLAEDPTIDDVSPDLVDLLIRAGADVSSEDGQGKPVLYLAIKNGGFDLCKTVVEGGADVDRVMSVPVDGSVRFDEEYGIAIRKITPLLLAIRENKPRVAEFFIERGADVNRTINDTVPLLEAAEKNQLDVVKALKKAGANLFYRDNRGVTALMEAASHGATEVASFLIKNDLDVNHKRNVGDTPLNLAAMNGRTEVGKLLIDKGARVKVRGHTGKTPLFWAIVENAPGLVESLIAHGADVNRKINDTVPLFLAAEQNQLRIVKALKKGGADLFYRDQQEETALMKAARGGATDVVPFLINNGLDVNHKNNNHDTALIIAARHGRKKVVEQLIDAGAKINVQGNKGQTAVSAAIPEEFEVAKTLLNHGAKLTTGSQSGFNMYQRAKNAKNPELFELVQSHLIDDILNKSFAPPDKSTRKRIDALIKELSNPKKTIRDQATHKLKSLGRDAIHQLKPHRNAEDPAVRYRVEYILEQIVQQHILKKLK